MIFGVLFFTSIYSNCSKANSRYPMASYKNNIIALFYHGKQLNEVAKPLQEQDYEGHLLP